MKAWLTNECVFAKTVDQMRFSGQSLEPFKRQSITFQRMDFTLFLVLSVLFPAETRLTKAFCIAST